MWDRLLLPVVVRNLLISHLLADCLLQLVKSRVAKDLNLKALAMTVYIIVCVTAIDCNLV